MRTSVGLLLTVCSVLLCFVFFSTHAQDILPSQIFQVSVTGTFRQDAIEYCEYCDCPSPDCSWVDDFTCPENPAAGADDNQQRWGNCFKDCQCFGRSGVGFQGVSGLTMISNSPTPTIIGKMTHYNNQVTGKNPERLRLTLKMAGPELSQDFVISYPLDFIETNNVPREGCDPVIQRNSPKCDDRFSLVDVAISDSFVYNNIQYTLEAAGFIQGNSTTPLKYFITQESTTNTAFLLAKITTFCQEQICPDNYVFLPPPVCGCACGLTDQICQESLGANWIADNTTCKCICNLDASTCPIDQPLNTETCGCGCNITDAYCRSLNPLFGVAPAPNPCGCACSKQEYLNCHTKGRFYKPVAPSCDCVCEVTTDLCKAAYGDNYKRDDDPNVCGCMTTNGGITTGQVVGIVIGSVAGAIILLCVAILLAGLLVWLIRSGTIPGIYGVRVDQADFTSSTTSPLYQDVWTQTNPVAD